MYSTMYLNLISFFDFHDSGVGGRELLSWSKFFLFVDVKLILLRNNIVGPCKFRTSFQRVPRAQDS